MITIICLVLVFTLWLLNIKSKYNLREPFEFFLTIFTVLSIVGVVSKVVMCGHMISYDINRTFLEQKKGVYQKQVDEVESVIRLELSKYPDIEKEIFAKIKSSNDFIVAYPQIKSNTTIIESAKIIRTYRSKIYNTEIEVYSLDKNYKLMKKFMLWF